MWRTMFTFRNPDMAWIVVAVFVLGMVVALVPVAYVEKPGFMLASGLGVLFFVGGVKALSGEFSRLAVLLTFFGVALIGSAWLATPPSALAESALTEQVPSIIGAIGGYFSKIEKG